MQTIINQEHSVRDRERYEAYRLYEEKTDIGERLSLPIHNTPRLEVIDGGVYGYDTEGGLKRMTDWSAESYRAAVADRNFSGPNEVERTRRKLEDDEAVAVEVLTPGECLLVMSPVPDAVMSGQADINGYRKDLARTFYRAYYRHETHVETMTLSLEQSNKQALREVGNATGMDLPEDMQSEAVLAARRVTSMRHDEFRSLSDLVRYHYDSSLFEQTGMTFFAGNKLAGRQDSMRFIDDNHDIIDEHMSFIRSIEARLDTGKIRDDELEKLRKRTAAALDERLHGGKVASIADGNVSDRMAGHDYGGECATSALQSTQEQMGLNQIKAGERWMGCPFCGQATYGDPCASRLVCNECTAEVRDGRVVSKGIGKAAVLRNKQLTGLQTHASSLWSHRETQNTKVSSRSVRKRQTVEERYGKYMEARSITGIGSARKVVAHKYTGEIAAYL